MCQSETRGRVLVVDQSEDVRHSLQYALDSCGYEVIVCSSGREALRLATGDAFDFIVLDQDLPDMTGIRAAAALRRAASPLTVIIGMGAEDRMEELLCSGANDFRRKPFVPYEIAMMIDGADMTDPEPIYDYV